MNDDKQSHEASSLRTYFDEQLDHLKKLADSLSQPHRLLIINGFSYSLYSSYGQAEI
ncbi:MAG TPA: hypothetical protein VIE65_13385 [Methylobacter sp.]